MQTIDYEWSPMKKSFTSTLIIFSLLLSPALRADTAVTSEPTQTAPVSQTAPVTQTADVTPAADTTNDEGTPVGKASDDGTRAAKRQQWQNIAIAAAAVAVAVTALILVSRNNGHHKK